MIKAIAIDDEPLALTVVKNLCAETGTVDLIKSFTSPEDALRYLQKFPADLLFLDIDMPGINGIELYKQLKQDIMVIFLTSRADYAVEGFNLSAVDFLVKPFTKERFMQAIKKAHDYLNYLTQGNSQAEDQKHFFIRADFSLIKVNINSILYAEGLDDYLKIHLENQKPIVARMTMKTFLEKLPAKEFMRIHRSFIVSLSRVERIKNKTLTLSGREFPIGASYENEVINKFVNRQT